MQPHYWNDAKQHLSKQCPSMKRLIIQYDGEGLRARGDGFYTLVRSVVGQQISVKAADAVWAKVEKAVKPLTPKKLLALSDEKLRACGLSASKVAYARNVAVFYVERKLTSPFRGEVARRAGGGNLFSAASDPHPSLRADLPPKGGGKLPERHYWAALTDDEIIAQLTAIKGIGSWTAEMFLIFHLMRPDVFPVKDLGVLKAMHAHSIAVKPGKAKTVDKWLKPKEYEAIAERWVPYRTVATWYLWRSLDPVPVAY